MSAGSPLMPVADALARILQTGTPIADIETVPLDRGFGRTLAADVIAKRTQPPFSVSAMDGYALRAADVADNGRVRLVGESAAGRRFERALAPGEAVRILTGAPVPNGADAILIQEDATVADGFVAATQPPTPGRYIRRAGLDFAAGDVGLRKGFRLGPAELALAAAMNHPELAVVRKPRVAILASGDELVLPGEEPGPDQIVCSNPFAVAAFVEGAGGEPIDLGIVLDTLPSHEAAIARAKEARADVLVTLGGASVGDHDFMREALTRAGMELGFWRVAMRPGKPLIHGTLGPMSVLGLPGNPVSSIVCSLLFLLPLLRKIQGDPDPAADRTEAAVLGKDLTANDQRADYLRARLTRDEDGRWIATPFDLQDSSMLRVMAQAQGLVLRPPFAAPAMAGEICRILRLQGGL